MWHSCDRSLNLSREEYIYVHSNAQYNFEIVRVIENPLSNIQGKVIITHITSSSSAKTVRSL